MAKYLDKISTKCLGSFTVVLWQRPWLRNFKQRFRQPAVPWALRRFPSAQRTAKTAQRGSMTGPRESRLTRRFDKIGPVGLPGKAAQ